MSKHFRLTEAHLKLLRAARVDWDGTEFGAPSIDCKRPYGNSDVYRDIGKILGLQPEAPDGEFSIDQMVEMHIFHQQLQTALAILCQHAGRAVEPGLYGQVEGKDWWVKIAE